MEFTTFGSASLLADIFQSHAETTGLTRKMLQHAARVSSFTADRWFQGETEPSFSQVCDLLERLPQPVAADLLGFLCGSRYTFDEVDTGNLDFNGDGRVDAEDALDGAIATCQDAQHVLAAARVAQSSHSGSDRDALCAALERLREETVRVRAVAAQMRVRRQAVRNGKSHESHESIAG